MKYSWILLDADNTFFDYDKLESYALSFALNAAGYGGDFNEALFIYRRVNKVCYEKYQSGILTLNQFRLQRAKTFLNLLGISAPLAAFSNTYLRYLTKTGAMLPHAFDVCRLLSEHCQIMMITNGVSKVQQVRFDNAEIRPFCKDIVIADEVGYSMPTGNMFDAAFERMGFPDKEEVLMVGSAIDEHVIGGSRYDIDTCWVNLNQQSPESTDFDYEINSVDQLLDVVFDKVSSLHH